jgi:hypothetical protein
MITTNSPLPNRQIDPLQRLKCRITEAIGLRQPMQFDEGRIPRASSELFRYEFSLNGRELRDGFGTSLSHGASTLNGVNTCFLQDVRNQVTNLSQIRSR